ncbi:MAG: glycosyltransferase family 9 protein [Thermomicrobiales bacterium]
MKKLLFMGPVLTASGYGVHARQLLDALNRSGKYDIYVESLRWGETGFLQDEDLQCIRDLAAKYKLGQSYDIAIQVSIPNEFMRRAPLQIGVTAGIETDRVSPQWLIKCNEAVDLVIVPSEHSRRSFLVEYESNDGRKLRLEKPIMVVHEGVDTSVYRPNIGASSLLDDLGVTGKNFVCVGLGMDKPEGRDRKNITRLIEWFSKTFKGNRDVGLILKTAIVNSSTIDFEITKKRIADIKRSAIGDEQFPRIHLIHGRLTEDKLAGIYNDPRVIAMVSPTHGEGFGLPLIEAAASGLPVMATDWSGHLDFLTKDGKKLFVPLEHDLQPIFEESVWEGVLERGSCWAVPRESDVCSKMQKMVLSSDTPRKWAEELAVHISENFSLSAVGSVFVDLIAQADQQIGPTKPPTKEEFTKAIRARISAMGPSLIYTMPMSAGDVFLSTGVVSALRRKHPGCRVYFATSPQYFDIVNSSKVADEVIEYQVWMQDVSMLEDIFDHVYTPNLAVQMVTSNWVHRGKGRNLIEEFAVQCGLDEPDLPPAGSLLTEDDGPAPLGDGNWVVIHAGGQKSARAYAYWTDLVKNLRRVGVKVAQVGAKDDISIGKVDQDLRGKTDHKGLIRVLSDAECFVGIDSYPMHVADRVIPDRVVAIFGSSYPASTGPYDYPGKSRLPVLIETEDRNGCERACYKDVCRVDASNPCLNNIKPSLIFQTALRILGADPEMKWEEQRPKIAGYTHILNPKTHGYPFVESIYSMIMFCDEVVVVDGGSTDGSLEELRTMLESLLGYGAENAANDQCKLSIIERKWDPDEPGMDGMQKAFGRAMVSPDIEFLWQQDADEVVHERDYEKIVDMCRRFPSDVDLIHLPVIELWGDERTCRTDRHSWKWRLSRNNMRVTHGINQKARLMDPKTGRFYAKRGMSDGCEYIDMISGEHLPHRGFYSNDLEQLRLNDPEEYGKRMNEIFKKLPSVWHYSWKDLPRKIKNFRDFWDKQWNVLYQGPMEPRFPDAKTDDDVARIAVELKERGGEHGQAKTFVLELDPPEIMR